MPLPDGLARITPGPWDANGLSVAGKCENHPQRKDDPKWAGQPVHVAMMITGDPCNEDFANAQLIARAPDHALLLAAIGQGVAAIYQGSKSIRLDQPCWLPRYYPYDRDHFDCPILTPECRAAIIAALTAQPSPNGD